MMKKSVKELAKEYEFDNEERYYEYIIDSIINGQKKQAIDLFNKLNKEDKNICLEYINECTVSDDFYKDLLLLIIKEQEEKKENKNLFVLYGCDDWHTYESMYLIGVFDDMDKLINGAVSHSTQSEEGVISKEQISFLKQHNQTQGRNENYIIKFETLNPII